MPTPPARLATPPQSIPSLSIAAPTGISAADAALKPTGTLLDSVLLRESRLSRSYKTEEVSFDDLAELDPVAGYCLVFGGLSAVPIEPIVPFEVSSGTSGSSMAAAERKKPKPIK